MRPIQRRVLWFIVFAFTLIFWYEASGEPLVWRAQIPDRLEGPAAWEHFAAQAGYGALFLALGVVLTLVLPRATPDDAHASGRQEAKTEADYHPLDWVALACGLGLLAGVLLRSYRTIVHLW
jgi:hypothetical protein